MNDYTDTRAMKNALFNAGLSVEKLAEKAGISRATAYKAAKGSDKMSPKTMKAIGDVLGVEPASLMK